MGPPPVRMLQFACFVVLVTLFGQLSSSTSHSDNNDSLLRREIVDTDPPELSTLTTMSYNNKQQAGQQFKGQSRRLQQPTRRLQAQRKGEDNFDQLDILVPLTNRDDNLRRFAARLKPTIELYNELQKDDPSRITTFRLLTTRYTPEEQDTKALLAFQKELSTLSGLPRNNILFVKPKTEFSRAHAVNQMLEWGACHTSNCLVARMDVDMDVRPAFLMTAKLAIKTADVSVVNSTSTVYFPIVWSAYQPASVELVQWHMDYQQATKNEPRIVLEPYSEHRGHWRDYGTGMWAMSGPDAKVFRFDDGFQGWGGEDGDFYNRVAAERTIVRNRDTGLVHLWHPKVCTRGVTVFTDLQVEECHMSREGEEGSELGRQLLKKWFTQNPDHRDQDVDETLAPVTDARGVVGKQPIWQA